MNCTSTAQRYHSTMAFGGAVRPQQLLVNGIGESCPTTPRAAPTSGRRGCGLYKGAAYSPEITVLVRFYPILYVHVATTQRGTRRIAACSFVYIIIIMIMSKSGKSSSQSTEHFCNKQLHDINPKYVQTSMPA